MESEVKLSEIFIGKADGSDESQLDEFSNLFYRGNNKYDELEKSTNKYIITGRKGTGKTILAKYHEMEQIKKGFFSKTVTKDDLILKKLVEVGNTNLNRDEQKAFIIFAILTEIGELIIQNEDKCLKNAKKCKNRKIKKVLKKNLKEVKDVLNFRYKSFQNFIQAPLEQSITSEELIEGSLKESLAKIKSLRKRAHSKKMIFTKSNYLSLISSLKDKIHLLASFNPITLIFDDLDEYSSIVNIDYLNFLIDFIDVTKKINQDVLKENKRNNKVIILIRQDILSSLNSNSHNLSKLIQDSTIYLNWLIKMDIKPYENPLIDMVLTKIQRSNSKLKDFTKKELYNKFFPKKILKKSTLAYLYDNSFGRPRDIVNYLEIIRQEYPDRIYFKSDYFTAMETRYSNRFLEELQNELHIYYSNDFINECIKVFELLHRPIFERAEIESILNNNKNQFNVLTDSNSFIGCMYKFGAIGMRIKNEKTDLVTEKKKTEYKFFWGYREDGKKNPDYNAEFIIHYGLKKSLIG